VGKSWFACPYGNDYCLFCFEGQCIDCCSGAYCGKHVYWSGDRQNIHFDHVRAYVTGGRTEVPVCKESNLSKSDKGLKEWLRWVRDTWHDKWNAIVDCYNGKETELQ
jgi:hypothetical protein